MENDNVWERCSSCRKPIHFGEKYFLCSVSTCKNPRTGVRFCSADCWDAHLGSARHREAWAEDAIAPRKGSVPSQNPSAPASSARPPVRKIIDSPPQSAGTQSDQKPVSIPKELETLVVVSKVKQLIRDHSGFSTSQCCIDALTAKVAEAALKAIASAEAAGRKTVMGRDIR